MTGPRERTPAAARQPRPQTAAQLAAPRLPLVRPRVPGAVRVESRSAFQLQVTPARPVPEARAGTAVDRIPLAGRERMVYPRGDVGEARGDAPVPGPRQARVKLLASRTQEARMTEAARERVTRCWGKHQPA